MTEINLYKNTTKGLKIIAMAIPFVVIGILMITQEPFGTKHYIAGWFAICFFGLLIPIGLFQTFDRRPQIIITENGIWDRTTNQDEVKWEQIIEAYPLFIFSQMFISIRTNDTFIFKKKQYKWASKINEAVGAQKLNLHLSQITIDIYQLTNLINKLSKADKEEKRKLIKSFKIEKNEFFNTKFVKIPLYVSISIALLLLSLTGIAAFMTIIIVMGIAGSIARWYMGSNNNSRIRKYAEIITWLGLVNMVLLLITVKTYNYTTEKVGYKISTEIETYKNKYSAYPKNLNSIHDNTNFNFIEKYFVGRIVYNTTENSYELLLKPIFETWKKYDPKMREWK